MKINEITNGDWVKVVEGDNEYIGRVCAVNSITNYCIVLVGGDWHYGEHDVFIEDIQPIELSQEILEKNGFGFLDTSNNEIKSVWTGWWILDGLELGCFSNLKFPVYFNISDVNVKVNYVHELQHALKLCRIEKEIIL